MPGSRHHESRFAVYASIGANLMIAATKFVAAVFTGSSAMIAEGVHSLADSADGTLLLVGEARARRPADSGHPFGHSTELYFWTLIVAMIFFALGGGMSIYEGIKHMINPHPLSDPTWSYVVLGVAAVFDGMSFGIAFRRFRRQKSAGGYVDAIRSSKDPTLFTVLLEDIGDLVGITLAFLGVFLSHTLENPYFDGAASIAVGLLLSGIALFLANESRGLLIGEAAAPAVVDRIVEIVGAHPEVAGVQPPKTMHLGPNSIIVGLRLEVERGLAAARLTEVTSQIEDEIRNACEEVKHLYIDVRAH